MTYSKQVTSILKIKYKKKSEAFHYWVTKLKRNTRILYRKNRREKLQLIT